MSAGGGLQALTAREAGLVGCTRCTRVWPQGTDRCGRCGHRLVSRDETSLSRVWAWWAVGLMAYIPANLWPMLRTTYMFKTTENTIVGGAVEILQHGGYGVAIIILVASVLIPIAKFLAIAFLALSVRRGGRRAPGSRQHLYEIVEYIGRWSMIDVFVVAITSSLVQLNMAASVNPGPASLAFALSVIFTMLSAQSFDSRMIWDGIEASRPAPARPGARTEAIAAPGGSGA